MDSFWQDAQEARAEEVKAQSESEGYPWPPSRMLDVLKTQLELVEANLEEAGECQRELRSLAGLASVMDESLAQWFQGKGRWFKIHRTDLSIAFTLEDSREITITAVPIDGRFNIVRKDEEGETILDNVPPSRVYLALLDCLEGELEMLTKPEERISTREIPIEANE